MGENSFIVTLSVFFLVIYLVLTGISVKAENPTVSNVQPGLKISSIDGGKIYLKLCVQCHGLGLEAPAAQKVLSPVPKNIFDLTDSALDSKSYLMGKISNGSSNNMIHFSGRLSEEQIESLAEYILKRRKK